MKITLHPDGVVLRHDDAGALLYNAAPEIFLAELKASLPPLPEGMVCFEYDTASKILVFYDAKGNAFPLEGRVEPPPCLAPALAEPTAALEQLQAAREAAAIAQGTWVPVAAPVGSIPVVKP
jgi:hypothetical protein